MLDGLQLANINKIDVTLKQLLNNKGDDKIVIIFRMRYSKPIILMCAAIKSLTVLLMELCV